MASHKNNNDIINLPAEWSRQSGIQLTWPHAQTDWKPYIEEITATFVEFVRIMTKYEKVLVAAQNIDEVERLLDRGLEIALRQNVILCQCNNNDTWARDHAFISVNTDNEDYKYRLVDFMFNGWGEKFRYDLDNAINRKLYESGILKGEYLNRNDFVLEGGSIESDGNGTIFTTSMCLLAPHRNQPLAKEDIEKQLKDTLGAKRIMWIDHGQLIGDDTDGHIDTIVRIAPDDTLLYVGCDNESDSQYDDFKALEEQITSFRTMSGEPYRLIRLPMPEAIYDDEERLPATYANFVIINGAVIVPTYSQPANDTKAMKAIKKAFPDRDIIPLDARTVIRQHGSLHCLTMQYPYGVL